jgi:glycosyltransferase involved in cell wall biosynthesis
MVKWILKKVEEIQPDVFIPDISVQGCFAGKWVIEAGIPVINTHRSDDALNWGKAVYFADPRLGHQLSGLVCVNHFLRDELLARVPATSIHTEVIPSGVPVPDFKASQHDKGLKIAYSGRLVEKQKQVGATLRSFLILAEKYPEISFTIIGDGPERERYLAMVAQSPHAGKFNFTGKLHGEEYKHVLAEHHVIVLLSDYEGTPGSVMDGMSCGLIPVCMKYNGADELVRDGESGFFVADREQSFFEKIGLLYSDRSLRERVAKEARQVIEGNFSVDIAEKKWIRFLEHCKMKAGNSKPFVAPRRITLPAYDRTLMEDRRLSSAPLIKRLQAKIKSLV